LEPDPPQAAIAPAEAPRLAFQEIWAYLFPGEEERWDPAAPLTDLCLFSHHLDAAGRLQGRLPEAALERARAAGLRTHLVLASSGQASLLHFLLDPAGPQREILLGEVVALAGTGATGGFQLDLEGLLLDDRAHLVGFLRELRARLPSRLRFSLALPAHTGKERNAYDYGELASLADRFLIMVYDEHWQGGPAGSISSRSWHDRVATHALSRLPPDKVVVGLPFYGRIWQLDSVARATRHADLAEILAQPGVELRRDAERGHRYTFRREVRAEGWFEDADSLHAKLGAAQRMGIERVGFWRLGQEDPRLWSRIETSRSP
jgi:spore germination protein YaaH